MDLEDLLQQLVQLTGSEAAEQEPQEAVLEDMDKDKDKSKGKNKDKVMGKDKNEEQEVLKGSQQAEGLVGLEKDVMSILKKKRRKRT